MQKLKKKLPLQMIFIGVFLLVGICGLILSFFSGDKPFSQAAEQVPALAAEIRKAYQTKSNYWGLNTDTILQNKIAPLSMNSKNGLQNALGKKVLVGSGVNGDTVMPGGRSFDVVYIGLNKKECVALASYAFDEQNTLGLNHIALFVDQKEYVFGWSGEPHLPISSQIAAKYCGMENTLLFNYE